MSAKHFLTASRKPSPDYIEMSAMLADMGAQIDELLEVLKLMGEASKVIKARAAKSDSKALSHAARPVETGVLARMFPGEEIH